MERKYKSTCGRPKARRRFSERFDAPLIYIFSTFLSKICRFYTSHILSLSLSLSHIIIPSFATSM